MSASEAKKATSRGGNYQDPTTESLDRKDDDDEGIGLNDTDEQDPLCLNKDTSGSILAGVDKVCP